MEMRRSAMVLMAVLWGVASFGSADARPGGRSACRAGSDDTVERPAPADLLPDLARLFKMPPGALKDASYIRCSGGRLLACAVGANLSCGKADARRRSVGADAFCRDNPGAAVVPLVATGHDTIYSWHCVGARAVAGPPVTATDRHGFIRENWSAVP